jgi:hypothetical protein
MPFLNHSLALLFAATLSFAGLLLGYAESGRAAQKKVLVFHLMRRDEAAALANERIYRADSRNKRGWG